MFLQVRRFGNPRFITRLSPFRAYHCPKCSFQDATQEGISLFCGQCSNILTVPEDLNYFKLLSIEKEAFNIDIKSLSNAYKRLQVDLHPDKYALRSKDEQELAEHWSAAVNKAYEILKKPVPRCFYLLELAGTPLIKEEIKMDPEFLGEIMELNEELQAISSSRNLVLFTIQNDKKMNALFDEFSSAWNSHNFEEARMMAAKINYLANLREKIKEYEEEFGLIR